MRFYQSWIIIILLFSSFSSFYLYQRVHINPEIPVNLTNITEDDKFIFDFDVFYPRKIILEIITNENIKNNPKFKDSDFISIKESSSYEKSFDEHAYYIIHDIDNIEFFEDKVKMIFEFSIYFESQEICLFKFEPKLNLTFLYMKLNGVKDYDISLSKINNFTNLNAYDNNRFFIENTKRFQRLNITVSAYSSQGLPCDRVWILEYNTREDYDCVDKKCIYNYDCVIRKNNMYYINFIYDVKNNTEVALFFNFKHDIDNLEISVFVNGGDYYFENNLITKNISNIIYDNPYYFFTKVNQYQTSKITLTSKCNDEFPFDYVDIYEYENKHYPENEIIKDQIKKIDNEQCIVSFTFETKKNNINYMAFKFIPKYDLVLLLQKYI